MWTVNKLKEVVCNWDVLDEPWKDGILRYETRINGFLEYMNRCFPPSVFHSHQDMRQRAVKNGVALKTLLNGAAQSYPDTLSYQTLNDTFKNIRGCAIIFTAGGDGERLRRDLIDKGISEQSLRDFTKATYPLKNFHADFGALHINLTMVANICRKYNVDIPVIVTTGAESSETYRVISATIEKYKNFGLSNIKIAQQNERLHLTVDEKIAIRLINGNPYPVTQPDETGGPLMKLKQCAGDGEISPLQWLSSLGCETLIVAQGTAVFDPKLFSYMAAAAAAHDCVGVGIPRKSFDANDPFGTFVSIEKNGAITTNIIEPDIRNDETRSITDKTTGDFLPFNTGFYAVSRKLIEDNLLPDYATPPKEVLPELPRSPKIGYAATDIVPLAKHPLVLTIKSDMYAVIKTADDLETISETAIRFGET